MKRNINNNDRFKAGDRVLVSNQYFMDKGKIDMPLYGKVIEYISYCDKVRIEDYKGSIYTVDSYNLEKDTVFTMKEKENDSAQDIAIKDYIRQIAKDVCSTNLRDARMAKNSIEASLYDYESDKQRMVNELNLRRALEKYTVNARKQNNKNFDKIDENPKYEDKYLEIADIIDEKEETVMLLLESFGIFSEIEEKERNREALEKSSLEATVKQSKKAKRDPLSEILDMIFQDMKDIPLSDLGNIPPINGASKDSQNAIHFKFDENGNFVEDKDYEKKRLDLEDYSKNNSNALNSLMVKKPKVNLPDCLIDMTDLAARGKYNDIIGREDEIDTVAETLARKEIRNPLLIGKPGAGKTAVVEELVKRSYLGEIEHLKNKRFYELRMNDLVAGTMYRGQLEQKLKDVMQVLEDDPNVVLFIDEVHMIVQAGTTAEDKNDVANALKPYLTSEISIIGATTFDEYRATFANDGALARRFNPIAIEEKTKEESIEIICKVKERFEKYHHVNLSEDAVRDIIDEIERRKSDNSLIAGALTAVDTICTKMKIKHISEKEAFEKWSDEVVLGVDRTNKGGKTQKIGFNVRKKDDIEDIDALDIENIEDDINEIDLDIDSKAEEIGTLEEEIKNADGIIYLDARKFERIEQKEQAVEEDMDEEYTLDEVCEILGLTDEVSDDDYVNDFNLDDFDDYIDPYCDELEDSLDDDENGIE